MSLEATVLQIVSHIASGLVGYFVGRRQRKDEASELLKAYQERLRMMAPKLVEELEEILELCTYFDRDWNTHYKGHILVKPFPLSRLDLEIEELKRWSVEHGFQIHNIVQLISEINSLLEKAQGQAKYMTEPRIKVKELMAIIEGLPDPFRVVRPSTS